MADNTKTFAVITGASGGLGVSFALECAERGYNLLLLGLPGEGLPKLASFLERNFPIAAHAMELDISKPGAEQAVLEFVESHQMAVSMLINNAGVPQNDLFEDTSSSYMRKMVEVNAIAGVSLISALLPQLKKHPRSHILNVSSLGGFYALPRKTCYSATKGFVRQFSQALRLEVMRFGVTVSVLCPGPMTTNVGNYMLHRQLNWFSGNMIVHPRKVAALAINKTLRGKCIIIPGRLNRVLKVVSGLIPSIVQEKLTAYSMKQLEKKNQ